MMFEILELRVQILALQLRRSACEFRYSGFGAGDAGKTLFIEGEGEINAEKAKPSKTGFGFPRLDVRRYID